MIEFIYHPSEELPHKAIDPITLLSEESLKEVWDNPSDDCYNDL
ncbi:MAG TPA: hypothetical protein PK581_08630 [Caldisericia bacterium]|nr:hypothetical protein [Caldisericia bacterium]